MVQTETSAVTQNPQPGNNVTPYVTYRHHASTDIGNLRDENQDTVLALPEIPFFLISDGMGGHRGGSVASAIVSAVLPQIIQRKLKGLRSSSNRAVRRMLKNAAVELNQHVRDQGLAGNGFPDMGATVTAVVLKNRHAFVGNLGDSRAYLLRKKTLRQVTRDHSVVGHLLRKGLIEPEQVPTHPAQGELTHYIGMPGDPKPFVRTIKLMPNDRFLLCTDGLTDMVDDERIAAILTENLDPKSAVRVLIDAANSAGGHDNITVLVLDALTC